MRVRRAQVHRAGRRRAAGQPGEGGEELPLRSHRKQPALVIRKYDYSETSQILRLLTKRDGQVSVLAKGTKKEKSSFGGPLDLFYRGESAIVFRPRSGLNILTGFAVDDTFPRLRTDLKRFYAACHLAEILAGMTREEEPHPELFDLVDDGLRLLSEAPDAELPALLASLETRTLGELGFAPSLTICASCGSEGADRGSVLSAALGGVLCPTCAEKDPDARPAPPGRIAALRTLAREPPDRAGRVRLSPSDARAIRAWLTTFVEWRLERRLRTAQFL